MRIDFSGKLYSIGSKLADLVVLNLLFLICCIPVVTIGAAWTALYYVTMKMSRNRESYIFSSFFKSFKLNFRQSTLIWIVFLILGIILFLDFRIMRGQEGNFYKIFVYLLGMVAFVYSILLLYVFPVLSKFYNSIKITVKNALLMALRHLPYTLIMLVISLIPFLLAFFTNWGIIIRLLPLYLLLGCSLPAYINSYFFNKIFQNYIPESEKEE